MAPLVPKHYRYAPAEDRGVVFVILCLRPVLIVGIYVLDFVVRGVIRFRKSQRASRNLRNWYRDKKGLRV